MSHSFAPVDEVYQQVRRRFLDTLATQGRLSRRTLARELGVDPGCIRAAFKRLEGEGMIESRPRSGTRLRQVDPVKYHEVHDLRELIEPYAARRAAWWMTPAEARRLERNCQEYVRLTQSFERRKLGKESLDYFQRAIDLDLAFHVAILQAARNETARELVENLRVMSYVAVYATLNSPEQQLENLRRTTREHQEIQRAIADGRDDDAEQLMLGHLQRGRNRSFAGLPLAERRSPVRS